MLLLGGWAWLFAGEDTEVVEKVLATVLLPVRPWHAGCGAGGTGLVHSTTELSGQRLPPSVAFVRKGFHGAWHGPQRPSQRTPAWRIVR